MPQPNSGGSGGDTTLGPRTPTPSTSNTPTPNSQNGVDMSLHPHFAFSSPSTSATQGTTSDAQNQSQLQLTSTSSRHSHNNSSNSSSNSSSPLAAALTNATAAAANFNLNLQAAAQSQLLAFQQAQTHFQKVQQQLQAQGQNQNHGRRSSTSSSGEISKQKSSMSSIPNFQLANLAGFLNPGMNMKGFEGMKDIFQIKTELSNYDEDVIEDEEEGGGEGGGSIRMGQGESAEEHQDQILESSTGQYGKALSSTNAGNHNVTSASPSFQQSATDLSRNSPDNKQLVNNKDVVELEDGLDGEDVDLEPVAVVQMDQGANKPNSSSTTTTPSSVIVGVGTSTVGVEEMGSQPR